MGAQKKKPDRYTGGAAGSWEPGVDGWLISGRKTTDTACWCPNADLKSSVENVTGGTTVCTDAADRKLIGNLWNEKCPDNTVTIA